MKELLCLAVGIVVYTITDFTVVSGRSNDCNGCKYKGKCIPIDGVHRNRKTCISRKCVFDENINDQPTTEIVKQDCLIPESYRKRGKKCLSVGKRRTIKENNMCKTIKCVQEDDEVGAVKLNTDYSCLFNGKCLKDGKKRKVREDGGCITKICRVTRVNETHTHIHLDNHKTDCLLDGKCLKAGKSRTAENGCVKRCNVNAINETHTHVRLENDGKECFYDGKCYKPGENVVVNHEGNTFKCKCVWTGGKGRLSECVAVP